MQLLGGLPEAPAPPEVDLLTPYSAAFQCKPPFADGMVVDHYEI